MHPPLSWITDNLQQKNKAVALTTARPFQNDNKHDNNDHAAARSNTMANSGLRCSAEEGAEASC